MRKRNSHRRRFAVGLVQLARGLVLRGKVEILEHLGAHPDVPAGSNLPEGLHLALHGVRTLFICPDALEFRSHSSSDTSVSREEGQGKKGVQGLWQFCNGSTMCAIPIEPRAPDAHCSYMYIRMFGSASLNRPTLDDSKLRGNVRLFARVTSLIPVRYLEERTDDWSMIGPYNADYVAMYVGPSRCLLQAARAGAWRAWRNGTGSARAHLAAWVLKDLGAWVLGCHPKSCQTHSRTRIADGTDNSSMEYNTKSPCSAVSSPKGSPSQVRRLLPEAKQNKK